MKKLITLIILVLFTIQFGYAQKDDTKPVKKKKDRPVLEMYSGDLLIDNQTPMIHEKKTFETQIQHRFGVIKDNGISDLFGIYAPSANTRIGFNYSILNNLMVGYGITRKNMYSDFQVKYNILEQTRKNTIPVTVTLYADMAIDGRNKDVFNTATADSVYEFTNRLSYFTEVMVSRKFNDWFSFSINGSFTHYNTVSADSDTAGVKGMNHDNIGIGFMGRFKFSPQSSLVFHYSIPLNIKSMDENTTVTNRTLPNLGIGYKVATASHAFEVFITTSNGIIPQETHLMNTNDWTKGEIRIGFNITRMWGF